MELTTVLEDFLLQLLPKDAPVEENPPFQRMLYHLFLLRKILHRNRNQHHKTTYYQLLKSLERRMNRIFKLVGSDSDSVYYSAHSIVSGEIASNDQAQIDKILILMSGAAREAWSFLLETEKAYVSIRRSLLDLGYHVPLALVCSGWCASAWMLTKDFLVSWCKSIEIMSLNGSDSTRYQVRIELMALKEFLRDRSALAHDHSEQQSLTPMETGDTASVEPTEEQLDLNEIEVGPVEPCEVIQVPAIPAFAAKKDISVQKVSKRRPEPVLRVKKRHRVEIKPKNEEPDLMDEIFGAI